MGGWHPSLLTDHMASVGLDIIAGARAGGLHDWVRHKQHVMDVIIMFTLASNGKMVTHYEVCHT